VDFSGTVNKVVRRAWVQIRSRLGIKARVYATFRIYDGYFVPSMDATGARSSSRRAISKNRNRGSLRAVL